MLVALLATCCQPAFGAVRLCRPTLNTNELVVAFATPQDYGAVGDGTTDDTAAFQNAMNAAHTAGGGIIFVPAGNYAFYSNLTVPWGVTLHGDWKDWTTGTTGSVGTTFKVYFGSGQTTNAPFIFMNPTAALWGINFWYPNQNPNSITPYPFTIGLSDDVLVQNVVLINSYQGIQAVGADHHILQTIIGSPLKMGIMGDNIYDVCHINDLRLSPNVWPASKLAGAPAVGGAHATWMRANGTGLQILRVDGETCMATYIGGYKVGIEFNSSVHGSGGCSFYQGTVTNCATALSAQEVSTAAGVPFTWFTLDGDVAISRTATDDNVALAFDNCTIIGRTGTAVNFTGQAWSSMIQFQSCTISNTLQLNTGVFNLVNCALSGSQQCNLGASATRAAFTGCTFSPGQNIVNNGNAGNLIINSRQAPINTLPLVYWTNLVKTYFSYQPAKTNLFLSSSYGATGNGTTDDTTAIQNALTAAGNNGGGIVYLMPGKYKTTTTLVVPSGVRFQGPFEGRRTCGAEGAFIWPYGGQGTTNGPVALALSANSGIIGINFSYETQTTNCMPFPPTIQGRGANVYAIAILCPNPYMYVDLNTYACTNHFIDMVDGWALFRGFMVGNGSSGILMNLGANWTYWLNNYGSASNMGNQPAAGVVAYFGRDYLLWQTLGNCTETLVNNFIDPTHNLVYYYDQGGKGPNATLINVQQDGSVQGHVFDSAAASTINVVNGTSCVFADNTDPSPIDRTTNTVYIKTTSKFAGTARFFNAANWGAPAQEILMGGGDVGVDLYYGDSSGPSGTWVNGGVLHLVNYSGLNQQPPYTLTFGSSAGISGKTNDFVGCYTYNGCAFINANSSNPVNVCDDYALSSYNMIGSVNRQLIPGSTVSFKALANGDYVCADNAGTNALIANRTTVGQWESYQVADAGSGNIALLALANNKYVCADNAGATNLIANRTSFGQWETFAEVDAGSGNIGLLAMANGKYVSADNAGASPLIANRTSVGQWESYTVGVVIGAGVTFYQDTQYGGTAGQVLPVGTYTTAQLAAKGVPAQWASAARVPNGRSVIMYANDNFGGTSWTLTADTPDFTTLSPNANDQMSSCKVQ